MPFGKFKGYLMENVPASYLIYIFENNMCSKEVAIYIAENKETLEMELNQKR